MESKNKKKEDAMVKDTAKIVEELKLCDDFQTFYDENREWIVQDDLAALLEKLIQKHGLKKSEVIRSSEIHSTYAYQIFSGVRVPERKKLLCLALAMRLDLTEVQTLLKCAGYAPLYVKLPFDAVVLFGVCKKMSVMAVNETLFDYGLETLG